MTNYKTFLEELESVDDDVSLYGQTKTSTLDRSFVSVGTKDSLYGSLKNNDEPLFTEIITPEKHIRIHRESILGPKDPKYRNKFLLGLGVMLICGSSNDFLGKTIYQLLPYKRDKSGLGALMQDYWAVYMLTFGSFFICSFAILTKSAKKSYSKLNRTLFSKMMIPATMDLLVTGGRYIGLIFLPAAIVSILKNGSQLVFLGLFRYCLGKVFGSNQWIGLSVVLFGLLIISAQDILEDSEESNKSTIDGIIGVLLMFCVGFLGAIRNEVEEILLKSDDFESDFVVGVESIVSLFGTVIIGIILLIISNTNFNDIINGLYSVIKIVGIPICYCGFLAAIYGKDVMQLYVTKLSSSMTRKLFQQLYPLGTWTLGIFTHYAIANKFGTKFDIPFTFIQLVGFFVVIVGTYFYMKKDKVKVKKETKKEKEKKEKENDNETVLIKDDEKSSIIALQKV